MCWYLTGIVVGSIMFNHFYWRTRNRQLRKELEKFFKTEVHIMLK